MKQFFDNTDNDTKINMLKTMCQQMELLFSQKKKKIRKPLPVHEEYREEYPTENEKYKFLTECYYLWYMTEFTKEMVDNIKFDKNYQYIIKRWGSGVWNNQEAYKWINNTKRKVGDIWKTKYKCSGLTWKYNPGSVQSFTNTAKVKQKFVMGKTHVSIGFVDLCELLFCDFIENDGNNPFVFIGYEMCMFNVVKFIVVYEMFKRKCRVKSILEVWFSSGWDKFTLKDFKKSVKSVFDKETKNNSNSVLERDGLEILKYWMSVKPICIKKSRNLWYKTVSPDSSSSIHMLNFKKKSDRVSFARYLLYGEVFNTVEFGNITMFCNPDFVYPKSTEEYFYFCVPYSYIEYDKSLSFKKITVKAIYNGITNLQKLILEGKIKIKLRYGGVTLRNEKSLKEIRTHNPSSISWSNIIDFCKRKEFLNMAKFCSSPDTVHYAHSMNWVEMIYGIEIYDYKNDKLKRLNTAEKKYTKIYQSNQLSKDYLITTPFESFQNIFEYTKGLKYIQKWIEYFVKDYATSIMPDHFNTFNPIQRSIIDIHFYFTFT